MCIAGDKAAGEISPFQALTTALAATLGTGNIVGVATAIFLGGPGAIFWMWLSAFLGMAVKYSEIVLAVHYRAKLPGGMAGGPMYFLERGLKMPFLALLFAVFGSLAAFGIGNMVQANSVAGALKVAFGLSPYFSGLTMALLAGLVILGGIRRIAAVASALIPLVAVFYLTGAFFAFSTLLSWCYYGEKCFEYIIGGKGIIFYRLLWLLAIPVGALGGLRTVWAFADILNGLMALPNLIGLVGLNGVLVRLTREYFGK